MLVLLFSTLLFYGATVSEGKLYKLVVKTADVPFAGTDATIRIRMQGSKDGKIEREIKGSFEQDKTDNINVDDYDIGNVTGMDIKRDSSGFGPNWKLDKITIHVAGAVDSIFNYNAWVPKNKWVKLTLSCPSGFRINAKGYCDVLDVDECKQNPPICVPPAECHNTVGSYYCQCPRGYVKKANSNTECEDVNECNQGQPCDPVTSKSCENLPGDYKCICKDGYQNSNPKKCININECSLGTDSCDKSISTCHDVGGTYFCVCKEGYTQGANNRICQPVKCGALSVPSRSNVTPPRCTQLDSNVFGDKCVMTCKDGYVMDDIQHGTLTCSKSGRWEGNMGTCNPVQCPALPAIANGNIYPSTCTTTGVSYTHLCTYSCKSGYQLSGLGSRQCLKDKTWSGVAPTCILIVSKPWIECPDNIRQVLAPGKDKADVSAVWKFPVSNVQEMKINPPEISKDYLFPPGMTKVDWTVSNSAGTASCSMYVTISDEEPPKVVSCPSDIYQISEKPKAVSWIEPTFSDNVGVTNVENQYKSGDVFQFVPTKVEYRAFDAAGKSAKCEFTVTLKRPSCHDPDGPVGGTKSCNKVSSASSFCTVQCPSGSNLYKPPPNVYFWQCNNGVWSPSNTIPDCVVSSKKDPNTTCEEGRIEMTVIVFFKQELHCGKCPAGMYQSSNTDCSPCPAGTYNDQQGKTQCTLKCPAGTSSLPGASSAVECRNLCPPGRFSSDGLGPNCLDCPRDTYQDKPQQTDCISCPNGASTVAAGSSSLNDCGAKPKVSLAQQEVTINEKETISLDCFAREKPTPIFTWKFLRDIPPAFLGKMSQGSLKDADGTVIGSRLTITGATVENTGSYECTATNTHGTDMGLSKLTVKAVINSNEGSGA